MGKGNDKALVKRDKLGRLLPGSKLRTESKGTELDKFKPRGRPSNEYRDNCSELVNKESTLKAVGKILADPTHKHFAVIHNKLLEYAYGKPKESIELTGDAIIALPYVVVERRNDAVEEAVISEPEFEEE